LSIPTATEPSADVPSDCHIGSCCIPPAACHRKPVSWSGVLGCPTTTDPSKEAA